MVEGLSILAVLFSIAALGRWRAQRRRRAVRSQIRPL